MPQVPHLSIAIMAFNILLSVGLPAALAIILCRKFKLGSKPFFTGCAVWIVFVMVLEKLLHHFVFQSPAGPIIQSEVWRYALYGGLSAGLFEESGRFIAMKTVLRKEHGNDRNSILYGAGHGGIEAFVILGVGMVNNLIYSILYNTGNIGLVTAPLNETQKAAFQGVIGQLTSSSPAIFLLSPAERITAIILHIALSVIVWMGVTKKRPLLFPLAILLHAAVDAASVVLSRQGFSMALTELFILIMSLAVACLAFIIYRKHTTRTIYA